MINLNQKEEFALRTFNKDFTPQTLIDRTYFYEFDSIGSQKLVSIYHYSLFVRALLKWPSLRTRIWRTDETATLSFLGGQDHINLIIKELKDRDIFEEADNSYNIDFVTLRKNQVSSVVQRLEKFNGKRF